MPRAATERSLAFFCVYILNKSRNCFLLFRSLQQEAERVSCKVTKGVGFGFFFFWCVSR